MSSSILVVENNPADLIVTQRFLTSEGFKVECVSNGREGLILLSEKNIDLVVSCQTMPFVTGIELAECMKSNQKLAHIPIILLTENISFNILNNTIHTNLINSHLPKPFSSNQLINLVNILLKQSLSFGRFRVKEGNK